MRRETLETLPMSTLFTVAQDLGIDTIPNEIDKDLLIDFILEIHEENKLERSLRNNYPVRIEEKKYNLLQNEEIHRTFQKEQDIEDLPERYGHNKIVLMLRDPAWAFVYWDFKPELLKRWKKDRFFDKLVIRVYKFRKNDFNTKEAASFFDIKVKPYDSSWYINLPEQSLHYGVELIAKYRTREKVIARSKVVYSPRGAVADDWCEKQEADTDLIYALAGVVNLQVPWYGKKIPQRIIDLHEDVYIQ